MRNNFQYDAPRAGLTPEPDGSYILDQQKAAQLDDYYDRKERDRADPFNDDWDDL